MDLNGNFVDKLNTKVKNAVMTLVSKTCLSTTEEGRHRGSFPLLCILFFLGLCFFFLNFLFNILPTLVHFISVLYFVLSYSASSSSSSSTSTSSSFISASCLGSFLKEL